MPVVPPEVMTEFLVGHPRDAARADRVLRALEQLTTTPAIARRAAWLLMRATPALRRSPSVTDGLIAAFGEIHGAVATNDTGDLAALAAAGVGFDLYDTRELAELLGLDRA